MTKFCSGWINTSFCLCLWAFCAFQSMLITGPDYTGRPSKCGLTFSKTLEQKGPSF